jgi:hypothetical protein
VALCPVLLEPGCTNIQWACLSKHMNPCSCSFCSQLKRMDMEARSLPLEQSKLLLAKVKEYRADLSSLKEGAKQASRAVPLNDAARAELVRAVVHGGACAVLREVFRLSGRACSDLPAPWPLQGLGGDYYSTSAGQRERMLSSTQRLENSSSHLQQGREQLIQTEVCCLLLCSVHHCEFVFPAHRYLTWSFITSIVANQVCVLHCVCAESTG